MEQVDIEQVDKVDIERAAAVRIGSAGTGQVAAARIEQAVSSVAEVPLQADIEQAAAEQQVDTADIADIGRIESLLR